jgi:hypothetical protein
MALCFGHAVPIDESAFLGGDRFPANGAGDGLRLSEEHRRSPLGTVYAWNGPVLAHAGWTAPTAIEPPDLKGLLGV